MEEVVVKRNTGRWTKAENEAFLKGVLRHGKSFKSIQEDLIPTRTVAQVRTHAKKHYQKVLQREQDEERSREQPGVEAAAPAPTSKKTRKGGRGSPGKRGKGGDGSGKKKGGERQKGATGVNKEGGQGGQGEIVTPETPDGETGAAKAIDSELTTLRIKDVNEKDQSEMVGAARGPGGEKAKRARGGGKKGKGKKEGGAEKDEKGQSGGGRAGGKRKRGRGDETGGEAETEEEKDEEQDDVNGKGKEGKNDDDQEGGGNGGEGGGQGGSGEGGGMEEGGGGSGGEGGDGEREGEGEEDEDRENRRGGNEEEEEDDESESDEEEEEEEEFIPLPGTKPTAPSGDSGDRRNLLPPWHRPSSVEPGFPLRTLHNEILDLCDLLSPTAEEKTKTSTAMTYARMVVAEALGPGARMEVFGSQLTGLVLPSSDIDTVVMGGPGDSIILLGRAMYTRQNRGEVREVTVIKKAKVPLVKFTHSSSGIQVDVCFEQASGLVSGNAAKAIMYQMQPVRPLVMVLKAYMGQRKLNETYHGGIGSFLLQLMVVALVQKCGRDAKKKGHPPPTNLGFFLDEFFDFYGNQLNYATTGITLLGDGGGGFYNKREKKRFEINSPFRLSVENPHDSTVDTASNSYKVNDCHKSFKMTSLRLKCAIQRDIRAQKNGGDGAETGGFLKYCVDPGGELKDRVLPPPTFCTNAFNEVRDAGSGDDDDDDDGDDDDDATKQEIRERAKRLMETHGGDGNGGGSKKKKNKKGKGKGKGPASPGAGPSPNGAGKGKRKASGSKDKVSPGRNSQGDSKKRRKGGK